MAPAPALKEWDAIIHALAAGEQIVDLRNEEPPADRFWWQPTYVDQRRALVKPAYRHWVTTEEPEGRSFHVSAWADVVAVGQLTTPEHVAALDAKSIWTPDYAASRLGWKNGDPLTLLVVRVHRLAEPAPVTLAGGPRPSTGWFDVAGVPADPVSVPGEPALSDVAFEGRYNGVRDALADAGVALGAR